MNATQLREIVRNLVRLSKELDAEIVKSADTWNHAAIHRITGDIRAINFTIQSKFGFKG